MCWIYWHAIIVTQLIRWFRNQIKVLKNLRESIHFVSSDLLHLWLNTNFLKLPCILHLRQVNTKIVIHANLQVGPVNRSILLFFLSSSILAIELLSTSSLACDSLCPPLHISVCDVITQFSLILTAFVLVFSEIFLSLSTYRYVMPF